MMLEIKNIILKNLKKDFNIEKIDLLIPPKIDMGDLSFVCFDLDKNPQKKAEELAKKIAIKKLKFIKEIKNIGPFVNFYFDYEKISSELLKSVHENKKYAHNFIGKNKKVLIEYPSQNTHKEFHIGHLRNVVIGNTIVNLYKKSSFDVKAINYVNDFGNHVVKCLWYILNHKPEILKDKTKQNQKYLGQLYSEANNFIKDNPQVEEDIKDFQVKFENKDKEIIKLWKKTRQWSIVGFKKLMQELKVNHESIIYESEFKNKGQKIVDKLLAKKIAQIGEGGAVIVDLNKYNLDTALLRKSNGTGLYVTADLSLAEYKFKKYKIDESIYITAAEQDFYFRQLFKILDLDGFREKLTHISYGLINLPSGKMSSRLGNIILYEDLKNDIHDILYKETKEKNKSWSDKKIEKNLKILTQAVLKFSIQKHEANKNITFDIKEALSFEGYNALYVLYSIVRIKSLFRKNKINNFKNIDYKLFDSVEEKNILKLLLQYDEIIIKALENYNPAVITKYSFELAKAFNDFYSKHNILGAEENIKNARMFLADSVALVLKDALAILSIDTVEEM